MPNNVYSKGTVLDYLWHHSRFYASRLSECEELVRLNKGHAAILLLLSCVENISKSVVNDYDSTTFIIFQKLYEQGIISEREHSFLNTDEFSLRRIRNLFAHANLGAINLVSVEKEMEILWPLTEDETPLLLYSLISDIVFCLVLKMISSGFIADIRTQFVIDMDESISSCILKFKTLSVKELLLYKGFPEDYISDDLDIPEDAKIRMIDNAPDINALKSIFGAISDIERRKE